MIHRLKISRLLFAAVFPSLLAMPSLSGQAAGKPEPFSRHGPGVTAGVTVAPAQAETACLSGDPYKLARLAEVIGSSTPPSAPITIGAGFVVQFIRAANMVDDLDDQPGTGIGVAGSPQPSEPPVERASFDEAPMRIFNSRTKLEYRVTMPDAMLRDLYSCHQRSGRTEAGGPSGDGVVEGRYRVALPLVAGTVASGQGSAEHAGEVQTAGWSDGDDTRELLTPTTAWPWRAITQSSFDDDDTQSRCTMTLIGPRHLITAAHCLVNFGTSNWKTRQLAPARDGLGVLPFGASQMTADPPAGVDAWYIVPDPWLDPGTPDDIDKYQWDIGLVLMVDRLGEQTGWMGYGAYTASELNQRYHYNRGYPGCQSNYAERPVNCQAARLYGDSAECVIDDYYNPDSDGWNREFSFGCDMSRGHSGSPIYHYRVSSSTGKLVPVVIAVVSWHECFTCSGDADGVDEAYPNHARRLTPWVLGRVSWLREQFP